MLFANVIVEISHEKVDKVFQYRIPEGLCKELAVGMVVTFPFGRGNRPAKGYVVEITEKPEYDITKMKELSGVAAGELAVESELISLAWWIKENYGGTMIQALRTVLPVKRKMEAKQKKYVSLLLPKNTAEELATEWEAKHKTARARLLRALIENETVEGEVLTKKLHITPAVIRVLEEQQILSVRSERVFRNPVNAANKDTYEVVLNEGQQGFVNLVKDKHSEGQHATYLLHGITGSGKTEVYIELARQAALEGKQSIILIPEIALTFQTIQRFKRCFGNRVSILHSRMSEGERYDQFARAKEGLLDVMIGPRSVLFTPFKNIGLIVIDEEHEGAYKSEGVPKYHARETAIKRASIHGADVVLGSATPSVEAYYKALHGEYVLYELKERFQKENQKKELAKVSIVDLREELKCGNRSIISRSLHDAILSRLEKRQQTMLFINRRGYAGFLSCRSCGKAVTCPHCDVSLSLHNNGKCVCHYCGYEVAAPKLCPSCNSKYIAPFKAGTQQIEELLKKSYPNARILRMDMDTTKNKNGHEAILSAFANHEADILVGTQMIVKGHDFPDVTLVGVLAADMSLYANDYRACERTFQLLTQAAGRAGRGTEKGEVFFQTYRPEHYSIQTAAEQDYKSFYKQEIAYRQLLGYPPAVHLLAVLVSSLNETCADRLTEKLKQSAMKAGSSMGIQVLGAGKAAIGKINDYHRRVVYMKHEEYTVLTCVKNQLEDMLQQAEEKENCQVYFDFDPMMGY